MPRAVLTILSNNLTIWSFPEGKLFKKVPFPIGELSNDWKYYASYHGVGELATEKVVTHVNDDVGAIHAFSPDSRYAFESVPGRRTNHDSIRVLELATGSQVSAFGEHGAFSLAVSPDGSMLASGHWDTVILWDLVTGRKLGSLQGFGRYVVGLGFSKDGKLLGAGTDFGVLRIWDLPQRKLMYSLDLGGGDVSSPAFSPDGTLVAAGTYGTGTVFLIDTSSGKLIDQQKVSDQGCGSVAFSPDGAFLITPSTGGLIKWPYDRGGTIRVFRVRMPN
jgi:WD40 repeat protein